MYHPNNDFIEWMDENIGIFGIDWTWFKFDGKSECVSVYVFSPKNAVLVALRWSGK
jgi:hypothetical protein